MLYHLKNIQFFQILLVAINAKDAVRTCRLARELLDGHSLVKLEVLGDEKTLYPNITETLIAADELVQ